MKTLTIETMRERVIDFIENRQTSDSYSIGSASLDWVPGRQEYLLILKDGTKEWESGGCGGNISMIDDDDIVEFYNEELVDWFDEEEAAE